MSSDRQTDTAACLDCGHASNGEFCPACGQQMDVNPRSVWYWIREFLEETVSLDGRVPRTFRALVTRPGFLTTEWHEGHRRRWSNPFRLYLLTSVIYFTIGAVAPEAVGVQTTVAGPGMASRQALIDAQRELAWRALPQIVILLVPVFAVLLKYAFDRRRFYTEHLVYAFHLHAFAFVIMASFYGLILLPRAVAIPLFLLGTAWMLVYMVQGNRRVYEVGWIRSVLGTLLVVVAQFVVLFYVAQTAARIWAEDPMGAVARVEERYWEARAGEEYAGFVVNDYLRLPGYAHTPNVRAHSADLLFRVNRLEEARLEAETALLVDPDHLLALSIAARVADADSLFEQSVEYRRRFLAAYEGRIGDDAFARHREELEDFRETAIAALGSSAGGG